MDFPRVNLRTMFKGFDNEMIKLLKPKYKGKNNIIKTEMF